MPLLILLGLAGAAVAPPQSQPAAPQPGQRPPVVRVLSPQDGSEVREPEVIVHAAIRAPVGEPVTRVYAAVDGKLVAQTRGVVLAASPTASSPATDEQLVELRVPIQAADTAVAIRAETAIAASEPAMLHLRWAGKRKAEFAIVPKLYLVAVGVGRYQRPEYALTYPAKDAWDFATAFTRQQGALYRQVEARVLTDERANKSNILDSLEWLQRQTTAKDVAVLFLAGHGVNDASSGKYQFYPHEADPAAVKRTLLSQEDIQTTVRNIAGKVLVFLDTCHSGNVLGLAQLRGSTDLLDFINELSSADNGVVVFAASTGRQLSKESPQWGNGAFTLAVVEGLRGRAAFMYQRPITVNMLDLYISERVKELTAGTQTPTTAKPTTVPDFPIAVWLPDTAPPPLVVTPARPPERTRGTPLYKRWWLWGLIGTATAGALGGLIYLGLSQSLPPNHPNPIVVEF